MTAVPLGFTVAALAGRMLDETVVPASLPDLAQELRRCFLQERVEVLICSAARGADLLALDVAGSMGVRRVVVLPFAENEFRRTSVATPGTEWERLFDRIIADVRRRGDLIVNDSREATFRDANDRILDEAKARARGRKPLAIIVWEGRRRDGLDTTAAFKEAAEGDFDVREIRI